MHFFFFFFPFCPFRFALAEFCTNYMCGLSWYMLAVIVTLGVAGILFPPPAFQTSPADAASFDVSSDTHSILICFRQGTVFLMHVRLSGSTSSTMTNGASSSVTMDRWSSSRLAAPPYSSKRGHTWYFMEREPFSHLPTCRDEQQAWH